MADNVAITAGSGTTIAADDVGGVLHQRVKTTWGPDGTANDTDVATGKPLPVQLRASTGQVLSDTTGVLISTSQLGTLGQTTASASSPVVIASDQTAVAVKAASGVIASGALASGSISDGANVTLGAKADAKSTATDTTAITVMQVLKQISASVQTPPSQAVTNAGTFAVQAAQSTAANLNATVVGTGTFAVQASNTKLNDAIAGEYETVAASQTAQVLGATGATGDFISSVLVIPATTSPGNVLLLDNATSITIFTGGATSVSNLVPFSIPLGMYSVSGAWKVTTGANVSCIGIGNFT